LERYILESLEDDGCRKIFRACKKPKSASQVNKETGISEGKCAEWLCILEQKKAVEYSEEGWKATELGLKVLKKYFE
jgi:hypothetical protein